MADRFIGARGDLGTKRLEMFTDDPMEDRALHGARLAAGSTHARRASQRDAVRKRASARRTT